MIIRYLSFLVWYKPPLSLHSCWADNKSHQTNLVPVSWTIFFLPKIFFAKTHGYMLFFRTRKFAVDLLISWSVRWRKICLGFICLLGISETKVKRLLNLFLAIFSLHDIFRGKNRYICVSICNCLMFHMIDIGSLLMLISRPGLFLD